MIKVYLGGPIDGCTHEHCHAWREEVKGLSWKKTDYSAYHRFDTVDPTRRKYTHEDEKWDGIVKKIVTDDKIDIANCTAIISNLEHLGTYKCVGSIMEIMYAFEMGKRVIVIVAPQTNVSPWIKYHCHHIVYSIEEAVHALLADGDV